MSPIWLTTAQSTTWKADDAAAVADNETPNEAND